MKKVENLLSEKIKQVSVYDEEHEYYKLEWEVTDELLQEVLSDFRIKSHGLFYTLYYKGMDYETVVDGIFDYNMYYQFCESDEFTSPFIHELYYETPEKKKLIFEVFETNLPLKVMLELIEKVGGGR